MKPSTYTGLCVALLLSSCATIVGDKNQLMPISSTPSGAQIVITDEKGSQIFKGATPTNVTLEKSNGTYWGKKSYTVEVSKSGYQKQSIPITASANGWYIGGNIVFGGLIGWFVVDPLNGAMYTLAPKQVDATLNHHVAKQDGPEGLSIVLLEDVPVNDRGRLVRVN